MKDEKCLMACSTSEFRLGVWHFGMQLRRLAMLTKANFAPDWPENLRCRQACN